MLIDIRVVVSFVVVLCVPNRHQAEATRIRESKRLLHEAEVETGDSIVNYVENPTLSKTRTQARSSRTPLDVEVTFGSDHLEEIINRVLLPWLNRLFIAMKLPDITYLPGQTLNNLLIHKLNLNNVKVLNHRATAGDLVAAITLQAHTRLDASVLIGGKGGSMLSVTIVDKVQLDLEVTRLLDERVQLSITRIELKNSNSASKTMKTASEHWLASFRNLALKAPGVKGGILAIVSIAVNKWGKAPNLNFPLDCLFGIPLAPSGGCIGSDFSHDGRLVNPPTRASEQMCRAFVDIKIKELVISNEMSVHLVASVEPWLEVTQLGASDSGGNAQQLENEWVGPIYHGKPMPYESLDGRSKPTKSYKDSLDACVRDDECRSVFGEVSSDGVLEYRMGRTTFPVPDEEALWTKCADEGQACHFADDESKLEASGNDYQVDDVVANSGRTEPKRFLRLRFGEFKTPTDFVERTFLDDGGGIPCRKDNFGKGLQYEGKSGFNGAYCKRLIIKHPAYHSGGTTCSAPGCFFHGHCIADGVYCPLERPCALVSLSTVSSIAQLSSNQTAEALKSSEGCIPEEVDSATGKRFCPTSPPSKHCWSNIWDGDGSVKFFTQPVNVIRRERRSCDGPYHLPCWMDIKPAEPPPALMFNDGTIRPSSVSFSLPTAVLNSALATLYSTGNIRSKAFRIPEIATIGKLCDVSKGFLCLTSMVGGTLKRSTEIQLQLQMIAPSKVWLEGGKLLLSLALQLSIHAELKENRGKSVERMLLSKKKCVRKEGVLQVSWTGAAQAEPRWVELERNILSTYSVHGRGKAAHKTIGSRMSGSWSVEKDDTDPKCFKMKSMFYSTHRFCSESQGTTQEWFDLMTERLDVTCSNSGWGKAEAARLAFGLQAKAGVVVEKSKYLCVRPELDRGTMFVRVGQLRTRNATSAILAKAASDTAAKSLLNFVIKKFGLLKPMQVWHLQTLVPGAGMKDDPPPFIEIDHNRVYVTGEAVYLDQSEAGEGGFNFNASEDNPCLRESDT